MANIPLTLRLIKGSKLTFAELDANFTSLANSINNLPQNDSFVTGGTFNQSTYSIDFTGNYDFIPFSTDLSYLASDITVTGGTYNPSTGTVTFYNNSGGTFQVSGFLTGYTNYYTTGVTLNSTTLEFDRTDLSNAYSIDLSSLLFTGNTSGDCITDLYVSNLYGCSPIKVWDNLTLSGSVIDSQGGGYLDLRYGNSDGRFYLGNDNGGYSDTFIQGENGYLEISAYDPSARISIFTDGGNAGFVLTNDTSFFSTDINLYTDTTSFVSTPNGGFGGANLLEVSNDDIRLRGEEIFNVTLKNHSPVGLGIASDLLITSLTGLSTTTDSLRQTNPTIISSQFSTTQLGIKNSVILGGYNLNATQDNTAYVDNLNINTIGSGTSVINLGLDSNGYVVTGTTSIGSFTGNTSGDCINDIYVSNIHSCSPLNINPNDEGNVYFGSTSGITIDLSNTRLGIGTPSPQYPIQILGSNSTFYYDPSSVGGRFNISGSTGIPRFDVSVAGSGTRIATGGSIGMRNWGDSTWTGYGRVGGMFMYAGNETYGLNFVNPAGTNQLTRPTEDYIRFYAGQDASTGNTPDIHIQGSGSTRGYVGIGTETPTSKLHVNGDSFINGTLNANSISISGVTLNPKQTIALFFGSDSTSPLDSTTYYMGNSINLAAVTTPSDGRRVIMPKTGNIVRVDIVQTVGGTLGSSETSTFTINNITQATSSTITTTLSYDVASSNNAYVLSTPLSVNQDDKVEIRWSTPAWVTNPTSVRHQMNVYLEY